MITPILDKLRTQGGTLYTFSSASKDLTRVFTSNDYSFKFSHFACLNLPHIKCNPPQDSAMFDSDGSDSDTTPDFKEHMKGIYLDALNNNDIDLVTSDTSAEAMNQALALHFQNYILNFETAILNGCGNPDGEYNNDLLKTPAERIFFNWLQKVKGIKFDYNYSGSTEYYEQIKNRTVQYVGDIDALNTVEVNGDSFNEVYLHIPSTHGATPHIMFKTVQDDNYHFGNYSISDLTDTMIKEGEQNIIIGKHLDSVHPYFHETAMGSKTNCYAAIYDNNNDNAYLGDLGYCIDFDNYDYQNPNENSIYDFEFNCILLYYDFTDLVQEKVATNLYGVIFLEEIKDLLAPETGGDNTNEIYEVGYIQRYPKYKETYEGNGNSFAFKVDLKIDTMPDANVRAETYVSPNTAESMVLYQQAMAKLAECVDVFYGIESSISLISSRLDAVETLISSVDKFDVISSRISDLEYKFSDLDTLDAKGITDRLNVLYEKVNDLNIESWSNINAGYGITLEKGNDLKINSAIPSYSIVPVYANIGSVDYTEEDYIAETDNDYEVDYNHRLCLYRINNNENNNCYLQLKEGSNLAVVYISTLTKSDDHRCDKNIVLYIDDTQVNWKKGQSFKIFFDIVNGNGSPSQIEFKDDVSLIIRLANYNEMYLHKIELNGVTLKDKNIMEIICLDNNVINDETPTNTKFIYEIK